METASAHSGQLVWIVAALVAAVGCGDGAVKPDEASRGGGVITNADFCSLLEMPHESATEIQALSDEAGRVTIRKGTFIGDGRIFDAAVEVHSSAKFTAFATANPRQPFPSPGDLYISLDVALRRLRDACD